MSDTTEHGENIANQIQDDDAYGKSGTLTIADVWLIVDNLQTHFIDQSPESPLVRVFSKWMRELESMDEDLPL